MRSGVLNAGAPRRRGIQRRSVFRRRGATLFQRRDAGAPGKQGRFFSTPRRRAPGKQGRFVSTPRRRDAGETGTLCFQRRGAGARRENRDALFSTPGTQPCFQRRDAGAPRQQERFFLNAGAPGKTGTLCFQRRDAETPRAPGKTGTLLFHHGIRRFFNPVALRRCGNCNSALFSQRKRRFHRLHCSMGGGAAWIVRISTASRLPLFKPL